MTLTTLTPTGKTGSLTVSETIFGAPVNQHLLAQAIRVYIDHLHQGTSKVKTRAEVNRTTAKWYRQKGTGNARHGAKSAPIFVGGGVAHGPSGLRPAKLVLSQQLKQKALVSALSAQREILVVADEVEKLNGKTKEAAALVNRVSQPTDKVLVVAAEAAPEMLRSLRNLSNVVVVSARQVSAFDVVSAHKIILTSAAVKQLETRLAGQTTKKEVKAEVKTAKKAEAAPAKSAKTTVSSKKAAPAKAKATRKKTTK